MGEEDRSRPHDVTARSPSRAQPSSFSIEGHSASGAIAAGAHAVEAAFSSNPSPTVSSSVSFLTPRGSVPASKMLVLYYLHHGVVENILHEHMSEVPST